MSSAIEIRDLVKSYGARPVVEGLSLTVERGSIYGLLGPNGSGKTTTLACALGLLRPTSGSARVLGEPAASVHRLQGKLSVVFDTAIALQGLTATQNLQYVRRILGHRRGRSDTEVLEAVGLADYADAKVRSLSLGQAKRLAIAGALLGEPELLVLDEPLSGLDTMGVRRMLQLFRKLREEGLTMMLSSHRLMEMQTVITHAGILFGGRIVKEGELDEVLGRASGAYAFLVNKPDKAMKTLNALKGVTCQLDPDDGGEFRRLQVRSQDFTVAKINMRLVRAGIGVSSIEEAGKSLQAVFEEIVDSGAAEAQSA